MSKKLHVKDLKRDQVAEAVIHAAEGTWTVASEHRRPLLLGAIAVAVLIVGGVLVAWRMDVTRRAALADHAAATRLWEQADGARPADPKPTWDEVAAKMTEVADAHPRQPIARIARLQAGLALLRAGDGAAAAAALGTFVEKHPKHWAAPEALAALAAAREDAGDVAGAEAALNKLREGKWKKWPDGAAQVMLGQLYERQGRDGDARALYESLTASDSLKDTTWGAQARTRLDEMGPAAPANPS